MSKKEKMRLDLLVQQRRPDLSRNAIAGLIMQGKVRVNEQVVAKAGAAFATDVIIDIDEEKMRYASRAGYKLAAALEAFEIDVSDLVILDAGISTGGFTSCLLEQGARRVYGVDVGYGQVHESVRNDPRVILMERTNVRYLTPLPEKLDMITLDLSFISILKVMPALRPLLKDDGIVVALIKPQFEAKRHEIGRKGLVKDAHVHERVIAEIATGMETHGLAMVECIEAPIRGATSGNKEFLAYFKVDTDI